MTNTVLKFCLDGWKACTMGCSLDGSTHQIICERLSFCKIHDALFQVELGKSHDPDNCGILQTLLGFFKREFEFFNEIHIY